MRERQETDLQRPYPHRHLNVGNGRSSDGRLEGPSARSTLEAAAKNAGAEGGSRTAIRLSSAAIHSGAIHGGPGGNLSGTAAARKGS
jgi:hypothetical protein